MINLLPTIPPADRKMVLEGPLRGWEAKMIRAACGLLPDDLGQVEVMDYLERQGPDFMYRDPDRGDVLEEIPWHCGPDVYIALGTGWLKHWRESRPLPHAQEARHD